MLLEVERKYLVYCETIVSKATTIIRNKKDIQIVIHKNIKIGND